MTRETLRELLAPRGRADLVVLATHLPSGRQRILRPFAPAPAGPAAPSAPGDPLLAAARAASFADRSDTVETGEGRYFLHVFNPPVRVVIVGAVHIAQELVLIASATGYSVTVIDPRSAFATPSRFPDVPLVRAWPAEGLAQVGLDRRTAVVTVTHDPKLDDPALQATLASDAFYVGALGSRRTHTARLERLREAGVTEDQLRRIRAPVGLDIGARTPGEIAASIVAEIVQALRRPGS